MQLWFKQKFNWLAMLIAAFVTLSFIWILVPAFSKLPTNIDHMKIAIIDRDQQTISKAVKKGLDKNLPFQQVSMTHSNVKKQLRNQRVALVIEIPKGFSHDVQNSQPVQVNYYKSNANGMIVTNALSSVVNQVNSTLQKQLQSKVLVGVFAKQMAPQVQKQVKAQVQASVAAQIKRNPKLAAQATQLAAKAQATAKQRAQAQVMAKATRAAKQASVQLKPTTTTVGTTHSNQQYQLAPMFANMGQYLGIMIASVMLVLVFMAARFEINNKWVTFIGLQLSGVIMTGLLSLVATGALAAVVHLNSWSTLFFSNWLFDLAVFEMTSTLGLLCAGLPSMLLQLPLFASQVVVGGAIVPRFALPTFYQWLSRYTPMYQGVQLGANHFAGLTNSAPYLTSLSWMVGIWLLISIVIITIGYHGKQRQGLSALIPISH